MCRHLKFDNTSRRLSPDVGATFDLGIASQHEASRLQLNIYILVHGKIIFYDIIQPFAKWGKLYIIKKKKPLCDIVYAINHPHILRHYFILLWLLSPIERPRYRPKTAVSPFYAACQISIVNDTLLNLKRRYCNRYTFNMWIHFWCNFFCVCFTFRLRLHLCLVYIYFFILLCKAPLLVFFHKSIP